MTDNYFSELLPQLARRSTLATIHRLGFSNVPLRRFLSTAFSSPFGESGSFLADPAFEAVFGWRQAKPTMQDLAGGLLTSGLVEAMDAPPKELVKDYRFAKQLHPYLHQLEAWQVLSQPQPQSVVVASGTGSGKTECFMVPILDRLARLREEKHGRLTGVRALFLYPLNSLINSQRDRLRAWTHAFGGDIRFCLYNGNTPEQVPQRQRQDHPNEVLDRETLRSSPPPVLVTNATMLEYMLVRTNDKPILDESQGRLEWVVLDEAHTYIGSQAAELALLIRRVLFAFGVSPEKVRFVATSATIGDPEGKGGERLRRFLAEAAGVSLDRVHLISGERHVPSLPEGTPKRRDSLEALLRVDRKAECSKVRYRVLAEHHVARTLRDLFVGNKNSPPVARLSDVCRVVHGDTPPSPEAQMEALRWLDLLSVTSDSNGACFLPLRTHVFHQTLAGLWACANGACPAKAGTTLDDPDWPFGQVYFDPRKHCRCGSPAYEVVACDECGEVYLLAGEAGGFLTHLQSTSAVDEFELEVETTVGGEEEDEPSEEAASSARQRKVLITNRSSSRPNSLVGEIDIEPKSRRITEATDGTLRVIAREAEASGIGCPFCGGRETDRKALLQPGRIGAPFLLGNILPTMLEYAPDGDKPADHPYRGRRLLTFNDSRQGAARMAAKLQQDAERGRVRSLIYHIAIQQGRQQANRAAVQLRGEIDQLKVVQSQMQNEALATMIADKEAKLTALAKPKPIPFFELAQRLADQGSDFDRMLRHYKKFAPDVFGSVSGSAELARLFLVREFGRRPKRQNNLETMGLVTVCYPALESIQGVPTEVVRASGFTAGDWRDFLKLCIDFFVRSGGSLRIPETWRRWLGVPFPQSWIIGRDEPHVGLSQRRWPRARRSGLQNSLIKLLVHALRADIQTAEGEDRVDTVLQYAWEALLVAGMFEMTADGRVTPLDRLAFSPQTKAWICPFTRRFLDTTLKGLSPYLPREILGNPTICVEVELPLYDEPFSGAYDDLDRMRRGREWLAKQDSIDPLRQEGVWSDLNDRVIELAPFFTAAEHSAQQDSSTLSSYERAFKAGDLNLLSCSTTMEMGIDIGGMAMVTMNNVPPHPANYLQRAGRAGRRRETRSVSMTLCKANPHDQAVFSNSRWAFDTPLPAPQVSLDSKLIVQRHVNAFLLTHFLAQRLDAAHQEKTKLACGWFFNDSSQPATNFIAWCRAFDPITSAPVGKGLEWMVKHSVFEGYHPARLARQSADAMELVGQAWVAEWKALETQEDAIGRTGGDDGPAFKAVSIHKSRLAGEYLLRELATKGFLPGYGFPSHISSFDNLTVDQLKKFKWDARREDNRYRRRELASRDRVTALREYAPGSEVVMDGLVYRSAGITLNWHSPASLQEVREIQDIRLAWRCHRCGASGSSHSLDVSQHCQACGNAIRPMNIREFLEPAGFAVDLYESPHNDVTRQHFVPVEAPWISAWGDWRLLPNPSLGRFRASSRGHVFHQSRGIYGAGYALCLACGRAAPMGTNGALPSTFQKPHRKLRGGRAEDPICPGSDNPWKIKTRLTLGCEAITDVLELQLKTEDGVWLQDRVAALTLATALRDAVAEWLGVQASEFGCDVKESSPEPEARCLSILIYDHHSAGYASSAERFIDDIFFIAKSHLLCKANCDSACPHCVLDFDQRFMADHLDRHAALRVLSEKWLHTLSLPAELAYFGVTSRAEYSPLPEAIMREAMHADGVSIRLFADGTPAEWDVGTSPLRQLVYRLAGNDWEVILVLPETAVASADEADLLSLASLADHPAVKVFVVSAIPVANGGHVIAEVNSNHRSIRWAFGDNAAMVFGPTWGIASLPLVKAEVSSSLALNGRTLESSSMRPPRLETGDRELVVHHEIDGQLQEFGHQFWSLLASEHVESGRLLADPQAAIARVRYQDRYLFTPLSVALLAALIEGLWLMIGRNRWTNPQFEIITTRQRSFGENLARQTVWGDWLDLETRDQAIAHAFHCKGIEASVLIVDKSATKHGRLLDVDFNTGTRLSLRFDQGVSYWRATSSPNYRSACHFDFTVDPASQGRQLAEMQTYVEGAAYPTEIFAKLRNLTVPGS
ncbi:DEAD/DEAH box helicase [Desulfovibrio oxamicus]|uniref:DEAD/DEAH box helicase n=1 Tax=Nitratidesulfovibrio oxamicus TaxID=32016 RepID=A0ABS0J1W6_9BACT|nr:DEAD/DEAH box helicase [Nitratidesulfovibrio oxamicus]MBG3876428.1 DEAD/DEAH box helicase [Nitratidesulfovibrio oxamicus]